MFINLLKKISQLIF